jgi:hypothetical protein
MRDFNPRPKETASERRPAHRLNRISKYRDGVEVKSIRRRLGSAKYHTVYEGEGVGGAMAMALIWREREVEGDVTITVDSTAAIRATQLYRANPSHWIWDKWNEYEEMVRRKHPRAHITIRWTPGHRDILGNERADEEAKKAALEGDEGVIPLTFRDRLPWSRSARLQAYNAKLKVTVATEWAKSPRYHRIRCYDPSFPSQKFVDLATALPRKLAVILFQLRTGHTILNKHLHRINRAESPLCPCCRREDETVMHYLIHCLAHANARAELHRLGGRSSRDIVKLLSRPKLLPLLFQFVARSGRFRTVFGELPPLEEGALGEK